MKVLYRGRLISKVNNYRRGKRSFYIPKNVQESINAFKTSLPPASPFSSAVKVTIRLFYKDSRRRDIDNPVKTILDALEGIAYNNDSQVVKLTVYKHLKQKDNAVFVEVLPCGKH